MGGAFNPAPRKHGAERGHIEEVLLEAGLEAGGSALATDVSSFAWAERFAESRCIAYLHHLNQRFANQWDPARTTDFLPRWLRILNVPVLPSDTPVEQRQKLQAKLALWGVKATMQVVQDLMVQVLGPMFVSIVITPSGSSAVYVGETPANEAYGYSGGGVTVPGGLTIPDGTALGLSWYSTIAHIDVIVTQPTGWDEPTFYATVAQLPLWLDDLLPAWVTWNWIRDGSSPGHFILDELHNLDNERMT
jgi:hypothetical protein